MVHLGHSVAPPSPRSRGLGGGGRANTSLFATSKQCFLVLATAIPSFLLGTTVALYSRIDTAYTEQRSGSNADLDVLLEQRLQQGIQQAKAAWMASLPDLCTQAEAHHGGRAGPASVMIDSSNAAVTASASSLTSVLDAHKVGNYVTNVALIPKANLTAYLNLGVPLDPPTRQGSTHATILYTRQQAQPTDPLVFGSTIADAGTALEHCDTVHVLLTDHSKSRNQCLAIVPNYESFYLQRFKRVDAHGKDDPAASLHLVGRGRKGGHGKLDEFPPPTAGNIKEGFRMLKTYLDSQDEVLAELKAILERIAIDKTVIVMVCNFGQSELLLNFLCQARQRQFDLSNLIVFATDQETHDMVTGMGVTAYFDKHNFGDMPSEAAQRYGDKYFSAMMMAKVLCVQLVSYLGYSFLFQDVDIVWLKHPLEFFRQDQGDFDVYFQDDGGHSLRYAPYSANTGFYFSRHNDRTRRFFSSVMMNTDLILQTKSHQQALIAVLNEHSSLHGLKIKVFDRSTPEFPGGFQWNQRSGAYMKSYFSGDIAPYIFHMSWTLNKANKVLYFEQFNEWWVEPQCVGSKSLPANVPQDCCLATPKFECHYRDKPSKFPCKESPPIDKGKPSFW
jgi:hypothetical protein